MEDVKWLEVTLDTTEAELDALCARLTGNGVTGLAIEDEEDFKTFLEQNRQYWDYVDDGLLARMKGVCRVKFYITDDADGRKQLEGWLAGIDQPYSPASLGDNDWAHSWQKYYKPMPVGERLYIVPEWERGEPVPAGKAPLYLNPGLTFGTGSHASTQLCLMGLERYTVPGKPVLDLGCGFGWHCRYAADHGAAAVIGVDLSEKMLEKARADTFDGRIHYVRGAMEEVDFPPASFEAVLSSLALHYVEELGPVFRRVWDWLAPGGDFVFSCEHPVFTAEGSQEWYPGPGGAPLHWPVDRYFTEGRRTARFLGCDVVKYHHTLTTYVQTLLETGFVLKALVEPKPDPRLMDVPGMADELRRPMMLLLSAHKPE